jgi:hypothetical protein
MALMVSLLAIAALQARAQEPSYFQQTANYRIEARLDEPTNVLHGKARLTYTNHAPKSLDSMYFHLHLNAFRPNSAWARREMEFNTPNSRRFQDLGPDDYAFEHLKAVTVAGKAVKLSYPGTPDSTVVVFKLPTPLASGRTAVINLTWDARLSTTTRREGRRGRHYDWAQWYPKVAVYDRWGWEPHALMPQGEFYGEFGNFDVTFDVAEDQVIGATGVPVEGDPGWKKAAAPGTPEIEYQRDAYARTAAVPLGLLSKPATGRKQVRWRAENVHQFAWTNAPDYTYEQSKWKDVVIHALYQPGDTSWAGNAVANTATALEWLDHVWGKYQWPQITNVHRIEGGGTEFNMMVHDGSAQLGLILHEVGHNYSQGMLANNEWKEGFLDEGMTSFQTNWYFEEHGQPRTWDRTMLQVGQLEKSGKGQPVATASTAFTDFGIYNYETYTKPSIIYRMLREYLGRETMLKAMHQYFDKHKLQHVTLDDYKNSMEQASGKDLTWFFDEWFHTNGTLDYSVSNATTSAQPDGSWKTTVQVSRSGDNWMPVIIKVGSDTRTLDSKDRTQTVEVITRDKPVDVVLDPDMILLDTDPANNKKTL